jgi:hypothetical protein
MPAGAGLILGRFVFHFCAFALIGVIAAVMLGTAETDETLYILEGEVTICDRHSAPKLGRRLCP